jgi:hypothetical protein
MLASKNPIRGSRHFAYISLTFASSLEIAPLRKSAQFFLLFLLCKVFKEQRTLKSSVWLYQPYLLLNILFEEPIWSFRTEQWCERWTDLGLLGCVRCDVGCEYIGWNSL